MWKYVSRRIRDTLERNVAHFDRRSTTGYGNSTGSAEDKDKRSPSCRWYSRCCGSYQNDNNTNSNRWNFEQLNRSWIGAITWSSALVVGWYASQLLHLKYKYHLQDQSKKCPRTNNGNPLWAGPRMFSALYPYVKCVKKNDEVLKPIPNIENVLRGFTPTVHFVTNEHGGEKHRKSSSSASSTDSSENDLGEVLNSIENKLGLAALENGHHQDGLNLLRSAANRNHAPAQYNLGLCYEMGLGVAADEKMGQQDAIKALKDLDEDIVASKPKNEVDPSMYAYPSAPYLHNDNSNIVPAHATLFVENAQMLRPQIY
ncbi:uncharacterized protein LOC125235864 isoform X2 [Leguminivora glycinivorella]|uniref:uncharacterized protein LOC125235864 isoform X2 n=1 Tax=Leguminivora glycinivorella TaxID=1035111 RepID=UPI00200C85A5|nr:uncharacterized protein LOC125235864 isoform X2 [Leguminivora glycinivorella]